MSLADLAGWAGAATLVGAYAAASSGPDPLARCHPAAAVRLET